jgi:hypothetical protein
MVRLLTHRAGDVLAVDCEAREERFKDCSPFKKLRLATEREEAGNGRQASQDLEVGIPKGNTPLSTGLARAKVQVEDPPRVRAEARDKADNGHELLDLPGCFGRKFDDMKLAKYRALIAIGMRYWI